MSRPSTASPSSASWSGFCFHDILRFLIEKCILKGYSFLAEMHEVPGTVPTRPRTAEAILTSSAGDPAPGFGFPSRAPGCIVSLSLYTRTDKHDNHFHTNIQQAEMSKCPHGLLFMIFSSVLPLASSSMTLSRQRILRIVGSSISSIFTPQIFPVIYRLSGFHEGASSRNVL